MSKKKTYAEAGRLGGMATKKVTQKQIVEKIKQYDKNPKICKKCKQPLPYNKRKNTFCDRSCSASFNNRGVNRWKDKGSNEYARKKCANCGH